jgi:hypothetical protein
MKLQILNPEQKAFSIFGWSVVKTPYLEDIEERAYLPRSNGYGKILNYSILFFYVLVASIILYIFFKKLLND